jgi:site-specific DNA-methyltransferase (adenine-specific)
MKHGTGGLNIDGCRIGNSKRTPGYREAGIPYQSHDSSLNWNQRYGFSAVRREVDTAQGRFPANAIFDDKAAMELDEQTKDLHNHGNKATRNPQADGDHNKSNSIFGTGGGNPAILYTDDGGASRFFYNAGDLVLFMRYLIKLVTPDGGVVLDPFMQDGTTGVAAVNMGFDFIGFERDSFKEAKARIRAAEYNPTINKSTNTKINKTDTKKQMTPLFKSHA